MRRTLSTVTRSARPLQQRTPLASRLSSSLSRAAVLRRKRTRKNWQTTVPDEDVDFMMFPRETAGNTYSVNWSLNLAGVTPLGEGGAFRNSGARELLTLCEKSQVLRNGKSTHASLSGSVAVTPVFVAEEATLNADGDQVPALPAASATTVARDEFEKLARAARRHLTFSDRLHVVDGAIGSHTKSTGRARTIFDCAVQALAVTPALPRTQLGDALEFQREEPVTLYGATKADPSLAGVYGSNGSSIVIDPASEQVIVFGPASAQSIRASVLAAGARRLVAEGGVPLHASVWQDTKTGASTLVCDATGGASLTPPSGTEVYAENGCVVTPSGVSRAFDSIDVPVTSPESLADLPSGTVIQSESNSAIVSKSATGNEISTPSTVIIVTEASDLPPVTRLNAKQTAAHIALGYVSDGKYARLSSSWGLPVDHELSAERLGERLGSSSSVGYLLNRTAFKSSNEFNEAAAFLLSGKASTAKATASPLGGEALTDEPVKFDVATLSKSSKRIADEWRSRDKPIVDALLS